MSELRVRISVSGSFLSFNDICKFQEWECLGSLIHSCRVVRITLGIIIGDRKGNPSNRSLRRLKQELSVLDPTLKIIPLAPLTQHLAVSLVLNRCVGLSWKNEPRSKTSYLVLKPSRRMLATRSSSAHSFRPAVLILDFQSPQNIPPYLSGSFLPFGRPSS